MTVPFLRRFELDPKDRPSRRCLPSSEEVCVANGDILLGDVVHENFQ